MIEEKLIGIFDSGVGGLTVAARIIERLPKEPIIYLGDTARLPYGTKSPETVKRYALACARILCKRGIKLLVVACNTASAHAMHTLRNELDIPVVGVVEPGARAAVKHSKTRRIGVVGTEGTIRSAEYQAAMHAMDPSIKIFSKSCPLFVPLAEEGWLDGPVPRSIAENYLAELKEKNIDTLVLGCTHYPLLAPVIAEAMGDQTLLVDSAESTSLVVEEILSSMNLLSSNGRAPQHQFIVSDAPDSFIATGRKFLGMNIPRAEWVDF